MSASMGALAATMVQAGILVLTGMAAWLSNDGRERARRWAPLFGLASQPFWMASALQSGAWGVLLLSAWYTLCWARGAWHGWMAGGVR